MDLPSGLDRADGESGRAGTATPDNAVTIVTAAGDGIIVIEEKPDSPVIERAEQATVVHTFTMSWDEALTRILFYGRGTILTDSAGNVTKVLSSKIQHGKGETAELVITAEGLSFDAPPDSFSIAEVELGINIIKYPRYFYAFNDSNATNALLNQAVIRCLQNYFENTTSAYRDALTFQLSNSIGHSGTIVSGVATPDADITVTLPDSTSVTVSPICGTDLAKAAAMEIIQKYWRNEETPYIVGYEIAWTSYYFRPPYLNPGGYVEDPIYDAVPQLPDYFWCPNFPIDTATIFDQLALINPQCYSDDGTAAGDVVLSWLRKADRQTYERTWFRVDRRWIGSPVGFWDEDLYNNDERPSVAGDYNVISVPGMTGPIISKAKKEGLTGVK